MGLSEVAFGYLWKLVTSCKYHGFLVYSFLPYKKGMKKKKKKRFHLPNCKTLAGYNEFNAVFLLGMSDSVSSVYCVNEYIIQMQL